MSPEDARLVAALTILRDQLAPVVDEITFGELDAEDRAELARVLRAVADDLEATAAQRSSTSTAVADAC